MRGICIVLLSNPERSYKMKPDFIITMDVEQDISSKLKGSYLGVEKALPKFLDLLGRLKLPATFFVTADVCLRYPDTARRIAEEGHELGCHGLDHKMFWFKSKRAQRKEIADATNVIEKVTGIRCKMFRTPKFGVSGKTITVLEELGYTVDSSVMPDVETRIFKKMYKVHSLAGAPSRPYYPSKKDVKKKGDSDVLEIPLTKSPVKGHPIGAGGLNKFGKDKMINLCRMAGKDTGPGYVMFLMHPWELVELGKHHPGLKGWVKELCRDDFGQLESFFQKIKKEFNFKKVGDIANEFKEK